MLITSKRIAQYRREKKNFKVSSLDVRWNDNLFQDFRCVALFLAVEVPSQLTVGNLAAAVRSCRIHVLHSFVIVVAFLRR